MSGMNGLSASELADLAGVTEAEVERLVDLGVLEARDGADPFLETDAKKIRLATACEQAGLPMAGIAAAIRSGPAVVRLLGGLPLPVVGGALGTDLPAGEPRDWGAPGAARQRLGGLRVRPH